ncbi:MAG: tetratricopeptide repeat protein [Sedimentisphaerales bacterium]|jgi:tetratricopeptide (TPR) repeat protein|nr:tetratricopeptide repeat protein [Sedimentisphaerales bacterium]
MAADIDSKTVTCWAFYSVVALGVFLLASCQTSGPVAGSSSERERYLQALVDRNFQDPQAHYLLAEYYHTEGLWDKAIYQLDLALRFGPFFRKAQVAKVRILLEKGDKQAADAAVDAFIRHSAHNPDGLVDLARCFQQEGLDQYALYCLQQATLLWPRSPLVYKELGLYLLAKDQPAKAKESLMKSFELDPVQPDVAGALGRLGVVVEAPSLRPAGDSALPPKM